MSLEGHGQYNALYNIDDNRLAQVLQAFNKYLAPPSPLKKQAFLFAPFLYDHMGNNKNCLYYYLESGSSMI